MREHRRKKFNAEILRKHWRKNERRNKARRKKRGKEEREKK